jgi:hypothetical protein
MKNKNITLSEQFKNITLSEQFKNITLSEQFKNITLVVIDTDGIGSCKSNYHTITTTTPQRF